MTFGKRLQALRHQRQETQDEVARALGVPRTTYASWESEYRFPEDEKDMLGKLATYFSTSIDYLLCRTEDPAPLGQLGDLFRENRSAYALSDLAARWPNLSPDRRQRAAEMERDGKVAGVEMEVGPPDITNEEFDAIIREAASYTAFILERAKRGKATE